MQYASMHTLFDSLCQCLGSSPTLPEDGSDPVGGTPISATPQHGGGHTTTAEEGSPSPNSRRTNRLELKDKQWDALFDSVTPNMNSKHMQPTKHRRDGGPPSSSPVSTPDGSRERAEDGSPMLDTAHALAKAKQAANPSRYRMAFPSARDAPPSSAPRSHKRKRPAASRDDIFRSRKIGPSLRRTGCEGDANCMNPISKFLSNHQGFANALCFATPVRDEEEEEEDLKEEDRHDNNSLASDANTLNTCEDSMLMLDHKLAQMSKNQPPMPLFHDFKVNQNEPEGLRRIVDAETHSSTNLMELWRQQQQDEDGGIIIPSSSSSSSSSGGANRGRARVRYPPAPPAIPEDEGPPPMKASSSGSSSHSCRSRSSRQIGEI